MTRAPDLLERLGFCVFSLLASLAVMMKPASGSGTSSTFTPSGEQRMARARLYTDLEASPILQNKLVPLSHDSPIEVQIMLNVYKILEIEEPKQVITMAVFFNFVWRDEGYSWNPADYANVSSLYVPYNRAWHPKTIVLNSAVEDFSLFPKPDSIRLDATGEFEITGGTLVHTHCYIDLTFFPFDRQTCSLMLGFSGKDIRIAPNASKTALIDGVDEHVAIPAEWEVTNHSLTTQPDGKLPQVLYTVQLDRASLYYLLCVLGPMAVTSQLTLLVLWIPPTSGERISFLMSIYVSATLYLGFVG
ncbi:acetylcholine receptor subunit alpha [Elysia marginata]|uniref:Acetylcholine receptor subunit alpha n=1 Tax=Elysia marginata TaxID=1093978 RepID=A0AAV4IFA8_9GAST|nr:acetylcholine receptor subunit alpha [Elysia marginata]